MTFTSSAQEPGKQESGFGIQKTGNWHSLEPVRNFTISSFRPPASQYSILLGAPLALLLITDS